MTAADMTWCAFLSAVLRNGFRLELIWIVDTTPDGYSGSIGVVTRWIWKRRTLGRRATLAYALKRRDEAQAARDGAPA